MNKLVDYLKIRNIKENTHPHRDIQIDSNNFRATGTGTAKNMRHFWKGVLLAPNSGYQGESYQGNLYQCELWAFQDHTY